MLPQTNYEPSVERTITEIPSKTYKLNLDTGNYVSFIDENILPTFEIENGHLIVTSTMEDPAFNIEENNLIMHVDDDNIADDYQLINGHIYFVGEAECDDRIMGYVDGLDAVRQLVYHTLMTERYAYLIYSNNYGVEFDQYKGRPFSYLETTIENTLKEALTYDLRIKNVQVDSVKQEGDAALVDFTVYSIFGNLKMEVSIVV